MYERKSTENMGGAVKTEGTVRARASCLLPLEGELRARKDFGLFCSLLYPQSAVQRHSNASNIIC